MHTTDAPQLLTSTGNRVLTAAYENAASPVKSVLARQTTLADFRPGTKLRLSDGLVEVHCDPGPYAPRKSKTAQDRLLREFDRLEGDPNAGGATRHGIVTAYRQDALRCAAHLAQHGPCKGAVVAQTTGVAAATRLMRENHYGWFEKVEKGVYALTEDGSAGLKHWAYSWGDEA